MSRRAAPVRAPVFAGVLAAACATPFPATAPAPGAAAPALPWHLPDERLELRAIGTFGGVTAAFTLIAAPHGGDELRLAALDELGGTLFAAVHEHGEVEVRRASPALPASFAVALTLAFAAITRPPGLAAARTADGALAGRAARGACELLFVPEPSGAVHVAIGRAGRLLATADVAAATASAGAPLHVRVVDSTSGAVVDAEALPGGRR